MLSFKLADGEVEVRQYCQKMSLCDVLQ